MSKFSEKRLAEYLAEAIAPRRRKRDGAIIVVTLALGLIGNFLFSKIELVAPLWLIALVAIGDLISTFGPLAKLKALGRVVVIIIVVAIGGAVSGQWIYREYCSQHAALLSGDLIAASDGKDHSSDPRILQIGRTTKITLTGPKDKPFVDSPKLLDRLAINRVNGELQLSVTVRDENNNLIAEITNNHWQVSSSKNSCWDKNYTRDSLEVKDGKGRVVLQVRVLPDVVQLQVEWGNKYGRPAVIAEDSYSDQFGIKPMFQYPSDMHWGQLDPSWVAMYGQ